MDKIHTQSRLLLCTLSKSQLYLCKRMLEKAFQNYEWWFWSNFALGVLRQERSCLTLFWTSYLHWTNLQEESTVPSSATALNIWWVAGSMGKKWMFHKTASVVDEVQGLKIKYRFSDWLKFSAKQKTKRAVPVSRSWYSRLCKFSSDLSNCTSFSGTFSKASANEGPGLWVLL